MFASDERWDPDALLQELQSPPPGRSRAARNARLDAPGRRSIDEGVIAKTMTTTLTLEELEQSGERELGTSDWHEITQDQINLFAEATGDHQWIHVDPEAAANGPFGTTVAHGYLTLSMLPMLLSEIVSVSDAVMGVNYGTEKVRFTSPVPSGSRVRLHAKLLRSRTAGARACSGTSAFRSRSRARRSPRSSARSSTWRREHPMPEAVIVAATRTPIGRARKGSLVDARPDDLAAFAIDAVLKQVPELDRSEIVDVMVGCGFPQDKQGMNLARRVALLADLPETVPGTTVNRFCASSLQTIRMAFHAIRAGEGDAYVAAGVESITQVDGYPKDAEELHPKLFGDDAPIANVYIPMGLTAENVAEQWDVSREEMDRFAQQSQERAVAAQESGFFEREITPWDGVAKDDGPRPDSTLEKLSQLEPAFKPGGKVTAGNSCPLNDGAAAVVVMSDTRARELGIAPLARIIASSVSGVAPEIMGVGPIEAVRKVLKQAGMTIDEVDVVELNEAFAAQVIPVCSEIGVDPFSDKLNPHGGAIALGHPYGMTGARIMNTLLNDLKTLDRTIGVETMCVGGGQGMAMVVERLN